MYRPKLKEQILDIVLQSWPIHASGICKKLALNVEINNIAKVLPQY